MAARWGGRQGHWGCWVSGTGGGFAATRARRPDLPSTSVQPALRLWKDVSPRSGVGVSGGPALRANRRNTGAVEGNRRGADSHALAVHPRLQPGRDSRLPAGIGGVGVCTARSEVGDLEWSPAGRSAGVAVVAAVRRKNWDAGADPRLQLPPSAPAPLPPPPPPPPLPPPPPSVAAGKFARGWRGARALSRQGARSRT